jgi:hypothetical protein
MKSFVLQVAIVCIIGSALCQTEPKVPQQFISNITGTSIIKYLPQRTFTIHAPEMRIQI